MNSALPDEVVAFARSARRRLEPVAGARIALRAERDRSLRQPVGAALAELGLGDLDVRADGDQFLAATQLCRVAGALVLPWPVADDLLRLSGARLSLIDSQNPRVDHGDLPGRWLGVDLDGSAYSLVMGAPRPARLGPFLVPATVGEVQPDIDRDDIARHLVFGSWRTLGTLEAALGQVVEHVKARRQFDRALAEFQTVRFAVADTSVALRGLAELAMYTSWRLATASSAQRQADATALRLHAVDTAVSTVRTCHQLLGAVGFCDEHDVSVFDRHLQPLIRLPLSAERLALRLVPAVRRGDLEGIFT